MITLDTVRASKGGFSLDAVTMSLAAGQYGVVIGPAGAGKTTLLEVIAGLVAVQSGTVTLAGVDARRLPTEARGVGLVYQHAFLFPHLSVRENIAYGCTDSRTVDAIVERFGIASLLDRDVRGLSGGERQLIALARTLVRKPNVLLLDEPFSALDPRRRALVRREVRALHQEWGLTTLQVTHDFAEAGLLGDVAMLLDRGALVQSGPTAEVFHRPANAFIAEFLGAENVFAGVARALNDGTFEFTTGDLTLHATGDFMPGPAHAVLRAEEITLARDLGHDSARNRFSGRIIEMESQGAITRVTVELRGVPVVAALTTRSAQDLALAEGIAVVASFKSMAVHLC
jgi:molybdopterin-binding protein